MKKTFVLLLAAALLLCGCGGKAKDGGVPAAEAAPATVEPAQATPEVQTIAATLEPTAMPEPTPVPEPAEAPVTYPIRVTLGAVGDIMLMASQVNGALDDDTGKYDFSRSFTAVKNKFNSVDFMMGNFETTLAGAEAGYSHKRTDDEPAELFNCPDEIVDNLLDLGFDFLTTANNHAVDKRIEGLIRTLDVLDEKGVYHTGTARSDEERDTPLVVEVKGIKLGLVSATDIINKHDKWITETEASYAVNRLRTGQERLAANIRACKDAGAEFVIAWPHWGKEGKRGPNDDQEAFAKFLLESGADLIIGSHPHVVQPIQYVTVERDGGSYTGLVVYSMGNFISNMFDENENVGLYLELTIQKDESGAVTLATAGYLPTYCFYRSEGRKYVHQVVPALEETSTLTPWSALTDRDKQHIREAREHAGEVCGTEAIPMLEDTCWIS